jgi:NAD(P)-dependent dehydrogenase (short-subunit alcohol dehydrogenase family)
MDVDARDGAEALAENRPAAARDREVVIVAGAGPGLGAALARAFGSEGFTVALLARGQARLDALAADLREHGIDAHAYVCDLGSIADTRAVVAQVEADLGAPTVLVHNASVLIHGTPSEVDPGAVAEGLATGAISALVLLQAVLPAMRVTGRGTILITGGGTALEPWVEAVGLSMQKAALRTVALAAAGELAGSGITVTTATIAGTIGSPGLEPDAIAAEYLAVHHAAGRPPREIVLPRTGEGQVAGSAS